MVYFLVKKTICNLGLQSRLMKLKMRNKKISLYLFVAIVRQVSSTDRPHVPGIPLHALSLGKYDRVGKAKCITNYIFRIDL